MNQYMKRVLLCSAIASLAYFFIVVETSIVRSVVGLYTQGAAAVIEAMTGDTLRVFSRSNDGVGRIFNDGANSDGTFIYVTAESDIAFLLFLTVFAILFRGACSLYKTIYIGFTVAVLLAFNVLRIGLMYMAMAYQPLHYDMINVFVLPLALLVIAAIIIYIWFKASRAQHA